MRKHSSTGPVEVTKMWFEKGCLHTPVALAAGSPSVPLCLCKSPFGTGSPNSFSQVAHSRLVPPPAKPLLLSSPHSPAPPSPAFFPSVFSLPPLSAGYECDKRYSSAVTFPISFQWWDPVGLSTSDLCSTFTWAFHTPQLTDVLLKSALKYVITPLKTAPYHLLSNISASVEVVI